MLIEAGGGGGPGLPYPQGDPVAISSAAHGLNTAAGTLEAAAGQVSSAAASVEAHWRGPAAADFAGSVSSVRDGLRSLAAHHREAAAALSAYASALHQAQAAARAAASDYTSAEVEYSATMMRLQSEPAQGRGAQGRLDSAVGAAAGRLNSACDRAGVAAANACHDAQAAARVCAARLATVTEDLKATALHKFLDLMGGPGTMLGALGVTLQGNSAMRTWNVMEAINSSDLSALAKMYPKQWKAVEEAVASGGENSAEALRAKFQFEADVADEAWGDMANAATGLNAVPAGKIATGLDILGKVGVVAAVASDVLVLADGQSSGTDKAMAGVNLAGLGLAATGTSVGEAALGVVGIDAVAAPIPVVGEVLVAGTALYFGAEWTVQHWARIKQWGADVGHGLLAGYHALGRADAWVNHQVDAGLSWAGHEVSSGVDAAGHSVASGIGTAGRDVESGLQSAGQFLTGLL